MLQSLQVNIVISNKNYMTNYNIYGWLEWSGKKEFVGLGLGWGGLGHTTDSLFEYTWLHKISKPNN